MRWRYLLALICFMELCTFRVLQGQSVHFLSNRLGIQNIAQRDRAMSPLLYDGFGFYAGINYIRQNPNVTRMFIANFSSGELSSTFTNDVNYLSAGLLTYTFYHPKESTLKLEFGWSNHNAFNRRINNNFVNNTVFYEYFTSFGPAARYKVEFETFNIPWILDVLGHVQLLGFMLRPSYTRNELPGFLDPEGSFIQRLVRSTTLFYPGNAVNLGLQPTLSVPLKAGNKISITYQFEFYRLHRRHKVTQAGGIWMLSLTSKL
jgi:hypothetical protein